MSINLKKIELKNIRSHKDFTFVPESDGITAISGANGTGKSTIVDSLAWALFGTKPPGVSRARDLARKGTTLGKDDISVRIFINLDEEELIIERRIVGKTGSSECEVWSVDSSGVETQVAGPAVSHAEPDIRKRLGMNEKSFLSAILVQQKQVDQLIVASPKERTQVIERLTGLDSISTALTEARKGMNDLKRMVQTLPSGADNIEELEESLKKLKEDRESKEKELETNKILITKTVKDLEETQSELTTARNIFREREDTEKKVDLINAQLSELSEFIETATTDKEESKKNVEGIGNSESLSMIETNLTEKESNLSKLKILMSELNKEKEGLVESNDQYNKLIEKSRCEDIRTAKDRVTEFEGKIVRAKEIIKDSNDSVSGTIATIRQLQGAITILGKNEPCPTCLQEVSDSTEAIGELKGLVGELKESGKANKEKITTAEERVTSFKKKEEAYANVVEAFNNLEKNVSRLEEIEKVSSTNTNNLKNLEQEVKELRKTHSRTARSRELLATYEKASERLKGLMIRNNKLLGEQDKASKVLKNLPKVSANRISTLEVKFDNLKEGKSKLELKSSGLLGIITLLEERITTLGKEIDKVKEVKMQYEKMLNNLEVASVSASLIEEFRVNRLSTSIPLLESYASDLLNRFTEGMFTGLVLDNKFNASVVLPDGSKRGIGLLSGGELSAAALSLRLAISMLLGTESSNSLIVLDEVLVSQDRDRAEIILNTIADVCKGQVIIIAHNDSIDGTADKIISL